MTETAKVLVIYGTRPEAIKMAPVIDEMSGGEWGLRPVAAVTGQHRQMLDQVNALFGIRPAYDLDIIKPRQQLADITSRTLAGLSPIIEKESPACILVQGDTTTCFAAALSGFYHKVPVIHLEAGLRTDDRYNPYPEEMNRRMTTQLSSLHLAPTPTARANLVAEGVRPSSILITGNTVIDALQEVVRKDLTPTSQLPLFSQSRMVLITAHRRESWGEPMIRAGRAIARLARRFPDVAFVLPIHLNPVVRDALMPSLANCDNVYVTEPLHYAEFAHLMARSTMVLTDSGGVQEEAPSLGKPVLVMRESTERPEAVHAGTVKLVGTDEDLIVQSVSNLLTDAQAYDSMARAVNPYGDGRAAGRCVQAIANFLGLAPSPDEFDPYAVKAPV